MERSGEIYVITCTVSGKQYVGQALHFVSCKGGMKKHGMHGRWKTHLCEVRQKKNTSLCLAIRKYGKDAFGLQKIEDCPNQIALNDMEQYWIAQLNTLAPNGYNLTTGGNQWTASEELKQKLAVATKNYYKDSDHKLQQSVRIEKHYSNKRKSLFDDDKHVTKICIRDINSSEKTKPHIRVYVYYTKSNGDTKEYSLRTNFQYNSATKEETTQRAAEFAHSLTTNIITYNYHQQQTGKCNKIHFTNKRKKFFEDKIVSRAHITEIKPTTAKPHFYMKSYYTTHGDPKEYTKGTYFFYSELDRQQIQQEAIDFASSLTTNVTNNIE
jgi:group I intron endonuclease